MRICISSVVLILGLVFSLDVLAQATLVAGILDDQGRGKPGFNNTSGPATSLLLDSPSNGVFYNGDFYFADKRNNRIRKISPDGFSQTVVGSGQSTTSEYAENIGGSALQARLTPTAVEFDASGNMYVPANNRIYKVTNGIITRYDKDDIPPIDPENPNGPVAPFIPVYLGQVNDLKWFNGTLYIASSWGLFFVDSSGFITLIKHGTYNTFAIDKNNKLYVNKEGQIFRLFNDKSMMMVYAPTQNDSLWEVNGSTLDDTNLNPTAMVFDDNNALLVVHSFWDVYKIHSGNKIKRIIGYEWRPDVPPPHLILNMPNALVMNPNENNQKFLIVNTNGHTIYQVDNPNDPGVDWGSDNIDVDGTCGLDATRDGEQFSCNPVNLATGTKVDYNLDLGHHTPYPINWGRYYHSKKGTWTFEYERSIKVAGNRLEMNRPDGVVLRFKKVNDNWVLDMADNKTVVNTPKSIYAATTVLLGYEYRNLKDEIERYDFEGRLQYIQSKEGWRLTMQYDGFDRLIKVSDSFNRVLNLTYTIPTSTTPSTLKTASDGERTVTYAYQHVNGKSMLTQVTRPDNKTVTYRYDEPNNPATPKGKGLLTEIVDENNVVFARYQYDMFGRATQTLHDPDGLMVNKNEFFYDDAYGTVDFIQNGEFNTAFVGKNWYTNGASKPRNIMLPCFSCQGTSLYRNNYDEFGNPIEQFDFNRVKTTNVYDTTRALPTEITQAVGKPGQNTTEIQWHPTLRLPTQIIEEKNINNDLVVQVTTNTYNANGQLLSRNITTDAGDPSRTMSVTYNAQKLPHVTTDPMGRQTTMEYDNNANLISVTNALGQTTTYGNYTVSGVPRLITLPNGLQKKLTLNANQQIVQIDEGSQSAGWRTTTLEYNSRGLLYKTTYPNGLFEENEYDNARRLTKVKDNRGERTLLYDEYSKLTQEVVTSTTPGVPLQFQKSYTYDYNGRLYQEQTLDELASYNYDQEGNVVSKTSNGLFTNYTYDEFNQLTVENFNPDNYLPDSPSTTTRSYYSNGLLKSATDERGVVTTYQYNGFGEIHKIVSPDGGQKTVERNKNGEPTQMVDARGVVTTITRDNLGRVISQSITTPNASQGLTQGSQNQTFVYDNCQNGAGLLCSVQNYSGTVAYGYNIWQDVVSKSFTPSNTSFSLNVGYTFDTTGNLVNTTYPSGRSAVTSFNQGMLEGITFDAQAVASEIKHYPLGFGVKSYKINGRLIDIVLNSSGNPQNIQTSGLNKQMFWNNGGRSWSINYISSSMGGGYAIATHYAKGYLNNTRTFVSRPFPLSPFELKYEYNYDAAGNRTKKSIDQEADGVMNYSYASTSNRLQSISQLNVPTITYQYDANGNTISGNNWAYLYDGENRMREASNASTTYFEYNALGQRVKKDGSHGVEYFVYDEMGRVLGVYNELGVAKEELIWMEGWRPVATARGTGINTQLYLIEVDHLNAPTRIRNQIDQVVWSWDKREAFGYHAPNEDEDGDGSYFEFNLRFPGQWFDKETGLFHNGFRDYNPSTGRYMQSDPLGLEAGFNTYSYVGSNPLRAVDPYGLKIVFADNVRALGLFYLDTLRSSSKTARKIIDFLDGLDQDISVSCGASSSQLGARVEWNPYQKFIDNNGNILADGHLSLFHELYHVYQHTGRFNKMATDYKVWWASKTWSAADYSRWTNAVEKDAIQKEGEVWREMGNSHIRQTHDRNNSLYGYKVILNH